MSDLAAATVRERRAAGRAPRELVYTCAICGALYPASRYRNLCWPHEEMMPRGWPDPDETTPKLEVIS